MIGKLHLHINNYSDSEDFFVSPLQTQDVILGAPWFHRVYACLKFLEELVTISHGGRDFTFQASSKGNTIPIVTKNALKKVIKKLIFSYLIYVKDPPTPNVSNSDEILNESEQSHVNDDAQKFNAFLKSYDACFANSIPDELPPSWGVDDHRIDLIYGSAPPNRAP